MKNYQQILTELNDFNKQLELRIKERTRLLEETSLENQSILDSAGEGIYGLDTRGHTTFLNQAAERMLGYSLDEMFGKQQHQLIHHTHSDGSLYPKEDCHIYATFNDGIIHRVESEIFWRKDGSSFPVEYVSTPIIRDGEVIGAVVVFQDVTERKKQEEALQKAKTRLKRPTELNPYSLLT